MIKVFICSEMTVANTLRHIPYITDLIFCIKSCLLSWPVVCDQGYFYIVYIFRFNNSVIDKELIMFFQTLQSDFSD